VKDDAESWEAVSPDLKGFDAQFDLRAIRQMIDAGSGMPPHWRGEAHDVSLATAQAMEHSASRHLRRRQLYTKHMVQDLTHQAYTRAYQLGKTRSKPDPKAVTVDMTDIDRVDNRDLADAAHTIAQAVEIAARSTDTTKSNTLRRLALRLILRFGGEQLDEDTVNTILSEAGEPSDIDQPGGER
jgi:D-alanyl-D-alanine dipeptidase